MVEYAKSLENVRELEKELDIREIQKCLGLDESAFIEDYVLIEYDKLHQQVQGLGHRL